MYIGSRFLSRRRILFNEKQERNHGNRKIHSPEADQEEEIIIRWNGRN